MKIIFPGNTQDWPGIPPKQDRNPAMFTSCLSQFIPGSLVFSQKYPSGWIYTYRQFRFTIMPITGMSLDNVKKEIREPTLIRGEHMKLYIDINLSSGSKRTLELWRKDASRCADLKKKKHVFLGLSYWPLFANKLLGLDAVGLSIHLHDAKLPLQLAHLCLCCNTHTHGETKTTSHIYYKSYIFHGCPLSLCAYPAHQCPCRWSRTWRLSLIFHEAWWQSAKTSVITERCG